MEREHSFMLLLDLVLLAGQIRSEVSMRAVIPVTIIPCCLAGKGDTSNILCKEVEAHSL